MNTHHLYYIYAACNDGYYGNNWCDALTNRYKIENNRGFRCYGVTANVESIACVVQIYSENMHVIDLSDFLILWISAVWLICFFYLIN